MPGVAVLGGLNMDLIVETPRPAGPGETREGSRFYATPGGKGGNQSVAAARILGERAPVIMVGRVGRDSYGEDLIASLDGAGVETLEDALIRSSKYSTKVEDLYMEVIRRSKLMNLLGEVSKRRGTPHYAIIFTCLFMIAVILAHIYIGSMGMEGAFAAMGSGKVDVNWAREHHDLWLGEVEKATADEATKVPAE